MSYFKTFSYVKKEQKYLLRRVFRTSFFEVGDVLSVFFRDPSFSFFFEGLCVSIKKRSTPEFSLRVRNILATTAVELQLAFYYNRAFFLKVNDFKRKEFHYNHSKLYYIGVKSNKELRVK
jgi:ribosomal protein L19